MTSQPGSAGLKVPHKMREILATRGFISGPGDSLQNICRIGSNYVFFLLAGGGTLRNMYSDGIGNEATQWILTGLLHLLQRL